MFIYLTCLGDRFVDCGGDGVFCVHGADEKADDTVTWVLFKVTFLNSVSSSGKFGGLFLKFNL